MHVSHIHKHGHSLYACEYTNIYIYICFKCERARARSGFKVFAIRNQHVRIRNTLAHIHIHSQIIRVCRASLPTNGKYTHSHKKTASSKRAWPPRVCAACSPKRRKHTSGQHNNKNKLKVSLCVSSLVPLVPTSRICVCAYIQSRVYGRTHIEHASHAH